MMTTDNKWQQAQQSALPSLNIIPDTQMPQSFSLFDNHDMQQQQHHQRLSQQQSHQVQQQQQQQLQPLSIQTMQTSPLSFSHNAASPGLLSANSEKQNMNHGFMFGSQSPMAPSPYPSNRQRSASFAPFPERKLTIDTRVARASSLSHFATALPNSPRRRRGEHLHLQGEGPFFSSTKQQCALYSLDRTKSYSIKLQPKMDRGFFLADNDWTCYRRNYFQVSGRFTVVNTVNNGEEGMPPFLAEVDGNLYTVNDFAIGISAKVSNSEKKVDLIQHTPKRDKGPQLIPEPKPVKPGGMMNINAMDASQNVVTYERLQFKTATANNGKRRAAQQYYVLLVDLYAVLENEEKIKIASSYSAPLVVRGRSPGHYADSHDRMQNLSLLTSPVSADERMMMQRPFYGSLNSPFSPYTQTLSSMTSDNGAFNLTFPTMGPQFVVPSDANCTTPTPNDTFSNLTLASPGIPLSWDPTEAHKLQSCKFQRFDPQSTSLIQKQLPQVFNIPQENFDGSACNFENVYRL